MRLIRSQNGVPIRLTDERWGHIVGRHPEVGADRDRILETLTQPDLIQQGDSGELLAVRFYPTTSLTSKHLVVVYREISTTDGFVITAYLARQPAAHRKALWKQ